MKKLYLLKKQARRVFQGHDWVYSNEVDVANSPLKHFTAGELVQVMCQEDVVGVAYINPHSLITARLLTRDKNLSEDWVLQRVQKALALREQFYREPFYRLVFGESDGLPGVVIDRFGDDFVMQVTTAGMEQKVDALRDALIKTCQPKSIWLQADSSMRSLENLPLYAKSLLGDAPNEVTLIENGVKFHAPLHEGQKTGWFYDHRENRHLLQRIAPGKKVLDLFSYVGGWGIQAAVAGAAEVTCVDASQLAIDYVNQNAALNKVADKVKTICSDVFDVLSQCVQAKQTFDVIVLDPPAFIKRRKDAKQGLQAYFRINQQALKLLNPGGILISASCSHHLARSDLHEVLRISFNKAGRVGNVLYNGQQGPDHPVHLAMPETDYLKAFFVKAD